MVERDAGDQKQLEVRRRHGGIEDKVHVLPEILHPRVGRPRALRRQRHPPPRGRVEDVVAVAEEEEAVAVIFDENEGWVWEAAAAAAAAADELLLLLLRLRRTPGEELCEAPRQVRHVVDEDASERQRQEVWSQQAAGVDHRAPRRADAAGHGEAARREAAENVGQHVVGKHLRRVISARASHAHSPITVGWVDRSAEL